MATEWLMRKLQRFEIKTGSWRFVRVIVEKGKPGLKGIKYSFIAFGNMANYLDGQGYFRFMYDAWQEKAGGALGEYKLNSISTINLKNSSKTFSHVQLTVRLDWSTSRTWRKLRIFSTNGSKPSRRTHEKSNHTETNTRSIKIIKTKCYHFSFTKSSNHLTSELNFITLEFIRNKHMLSKNTNKNWIKTKSYTLYHSSRFSNLLYDFYRNAN